MKIQATEHLIVPQLNRDNGTFTNAVVFRGEIINCISNDCGPVYISLDGRIIPANKALTKHD